MRLSWRKETGFASPGYALDRLTWRNLSAARYEPLSWHPITDMGAVLREAMICVWDYCLIRSALAHRARYGTYRLVLSAARRE